MRNCGPGRIGYKGNTHSAIWKDGGTGVQGVGMPPPRGAGGAGVLESSSLTKEKWDSRRFRLFAEYWSGFFSRVATGPRR